MWYVRSARCRGGWLGLAAGAALLAAVGPGCHRVPLRFRDAEPPAMPRTRVDQAPAPAPVEPLAAAVPTGEVSPITEGAARADNRPLTRIVSSHSPTPLLDAAIERASAEEAVPNLVAEAEAQVGTKPTEGPSKKDPSATPTDSPKVDSEVRSATVPPLSLPQPQPQPPPLSTADLPLAPGPDEAAPAVVKSEASRPFAERWSEAVDRLRTMAESQGAGKADPSSGWTARTRLLDLLEAEPPSDDQADLWLALLDVISSTDQDDDHDGRVGRAVESLESSARPRISELKLCRKVAGFGNYETIDGTTLRPGHPVILYCEMTGLRYDSAEGGYRSRLASRVELRAAAADRPVWSQDLGTAEDLCRRRRRDYYVNYRLTIPASLTPGRYELRLIQTDLNGDREVGSSLPLDVRP